MIFARTCIGLVCCFLAVTGACKPANPFSYTPISDARFLSPVEQHIRLPVPIVAVKQVNEVCFAYSDETTIIQISAPPRFADGSELRIVATLFDKMDNRFELAKITENGPNYLCLAPEDYDTWLNIYKKELQFTRVIVKVNQPVHVTKIEWKAHNSWDMK